MIPEESPEHRTNFQEDPFETADLRGRSRSAALTQEPKELLSVPTATNHLSLKRGGAPVTGEDSCVSLFSMDKCSDLMDYDLEMDDMSYEFVFGDEYDNEGDSSIYFGASERLLDDESCVTSAATSVNENGVDNVDRAKPSIQFPVSNSAQLQVFHARLEHLILNVPDFPPAKTFVE